MNISDKRLRISIATLGFCVAGAVCADRVQAQGALLTLNANVQVTNLHTSVTHVGLGCTAPLPSPIAGIPGLPSTTSIPYARATPIPVVNRVYSGVVTASSNVPQTILAVPANRTLSVTCVLELYQGGGYREAAA